MIDYIKRASVLMVASLIILIYPFSAKADDGWVHSTEPWDYKNGLLNDDYIIKSHNLHEYMFDDDPETEFGIHSGTEYFIDFIQPVNIKGAYINLRRLYSTTTFYFSDGRVESLTPSNGANYYDLDYKDIIKITFSKGTNGSAYIKEIDFFGSYEKDSYPPVEILSIVPKSKEIVVNFKKPDEAQAVDVWLNNQKIERVNTDIYTYQYLMPDTDYELMFLNYYGDDKYGAAVRETVRTKKETVGEVLNLTATATSHEQVNLNWSNPNQSNFSHVTIYRDEVKKQGILNKLKFFMVAHANDATKLFETNGTYFIDHSVMASTQYEYLVTTTDDAGKESVGVSETVTTPQKGKPEPPVSEIEKDENGDYLVTWTSPTEGKVKIVIDGKDYVVINASQGSYLIPGKDMVYGMLGQPKVVVIAIDSDGDESGGKAPGPPGSTDDGGKGEGDIGKVKLPFDASDVMRDIFSFIGTLDRLILLVLAIILTPLIIKLLKTTIMKKEEKRRQI